jgi:hypothetical protein
LSMPATSWFRRSVGAATESVQSCLNAFTRSALIGEDG